MENMPTPHRKDPVNLNVWTQNLLAAMLTAAPPQHPVRPRMKKAHRLSLSQGQHGKPHGYKWQHTKSLHAGCVVTQTVEGFYLLKKKIKKNLEIQDSTLGHAVHESRCWPSQNCSHKVESTHRCMLQHYKFTFQEAQTCAIRTMCTKQAPCRHGLPRLE